MLSTSLSVTTWIKASQLSISLTFSDLKRFYRICRFLSLFSNHKNLRAAPIFDHLLLLRHLPSHNDYQDAHKYTSRCLHRPYLKHFWTVLKQFWTDFEGILDRIWRNFGPILKHFLTVFEAILDRLWSNFGPILKQFWTDFEAILDRFWSKFGLFLKQLWTVFHSNMVLKTS